MSLPYMKMYWGDYLGDTYHLRAIEHGGYLLMIAHYWRAGCLPDDPDKLARIARMTRKEWDRYGDTIMQFFPDGKHKRIDGERTKAETISEVNKLSAKKRWNNNEQSKSLETLTEVDANADQAHSVGNANHNHSHNHNQNQSKEVTKRVISPRGSRLPIDWQPSIEEQDFARQLGIDPHAEADRFRDYWTAQAGQRATKANWTATWRNWCRNAKPTKPTASTMASELLAWAKEKDDEQRISNAGSFDPFGLLSSNKSG